MRIDPDTNHTRVIGSLASSLRCDDCMTAVALVKVQRADAGAGGESQ